MPTHSLTVVVAGAMNPAIHHPAWYDLGNPAANHEFQTATNVIVLPQMSTFVIDEIKVECMPDRWTCGTNSKDIKIHTRVLQIAKNTFSRLSETPVSAMGLNFERMGVLRAGNIPFSQLLKEMGLNEFSFSQLSLTRLLPAEKVENMTINRTMNVSIHAQKNTSAIAKTNLHHKITAHGHFDLSPLLDWAMDRSSALLEEMYNGLFAQENGA